MALPLNVAQGVAAEALRGVYKAAGTITGPALVTGTITADTYDVCGADGYPIGIVYDNYTAGQLMKVFALRDTCIAIASGSITIGDIIKSAASGKVIDETNVVIPTVFSVGQAITAASDGQYVYFNGMK